jgi:hypothetical protein
MSRLVALQRRCQAVKVQRFQRFPRVDKPYLLH